MQTCLIGVGSNLGSRLQNIESAVELIANHSAIELIGKSRWLQSAPIGGPSDQGEFLNGAIAISTDLAPRELLEILLTTERSLGRERKSRWAPRTIDLDLLLVDQVVSSDDRLTIPHPWMAIRPFVLEPAVEIVPSLVHPTIGWTMERLWDHLRYGPNQLLLIAPSHQASENGLTSAGDSLQLTVSQFEPTRSPTSTPSARIATKPNRSEWSVLTIITDELTQPAQLLDAIRSSTAPKLTLCLIDPATDQWVVNAVMQAKLGPFLALDMTDQQRTQHDVKAALEGIS